VFWLDATGLTPVAVAHGLGEAVLARSGRTAFIRFLAVGFHRFGSFAVARNGRGLRVLASPEEERRLARETPLLRLHIDPPRAEVLDRLGMATVGQLGAPAGGCGAPVRRRPQAFCTAWPRGNCGSRSRRSGRSPPAGAPHPRRPGERRGRDRGAGGGSTPPLPGRGAPAGTPRRRAAPGPPLRPLGEHAERLRPAEATVDPRRLLELVRSAPESAARLSRPRAGGAPPGDEVAAGPGRTGSFPRAEEGAEAPSGAWRACGRAWAACRRASARAGCHLPEASFTWEAFDRFPTPCPARPTPASDPAAPSSPEPLPFRPKQDRTAGCCAASTAGRWTASWARSWSPVAGGRGPSIAPTTSAETKGGERLWVYYDREHRRWYLQGCLA
jgi:protein ImuB